MKFLTALLNAYRKDPLGAASEVANITLLQRKLLLATKTRLYDSYALPSKDYDLWKRRLEDMSWVEMLAVDLDAIEDDVLWDMYFKSRAYEHKYLP